jgi:pyruvate carboxylase subunit A/propionyl-CoA carboxylase alpha chain
MNTRLQVEHPVTEMVTGLDLVRLQIEIADGAAIDIQPLISGHAIEARLYAEDPVHDFLPVTGKIHRFGVPQFPGVRVDSGVEDGSMVSVFYDPMLAKVIAHGTTRDEAAEVLARALRLALIHGPVTNRELLVRILEHEEFRSGAIDTHFLERHDPVELGRPLADMQTEHLSAVAAALADQAYERSRSRVLASIPSGWRNRPGHSQERSYRGDHGTHVIRYSVTPMPVVEGLSLIEITECSPARVAFNHHGLDHSFTVSRYGEARHVDSELAPVRLEALSRFPSTEAAETPGSLQAPMPGRVIRVEAAVGDAVKAGQVLVVLEAMKMEHTLRSPHDGTVIEVDCSPGDQVEAGIVLVVIGQPSTTG